jgi:hypothetical protein
MARTGETPQMAVMANPRELEQTLGERDQPEQRERLAALGSIPSGTFAECTCPEWCEHDHENE